MSPSCCSTCLINDRKAHGKLVKSCHKSEAELAVPRLQGSTERSVSIRRKLGFGLVSTIGVDYQIHVANHLGLSSVGKDPGRFPREKINRQGYHMEFDEDPALVDLDGVVQLTGPADPKTV
ncbi:hypothetical protein Tco_0847654 [Tanacetum coccineum]